MKHLSRGPRRVALLTAAALAVAPALIVGSAATAATNGNWWYSAYHVADATSAGWTGKGVKVAVIDEQIDPSAPVFSRAHLSVDPTPLCAGAGVSSTTTNPDAYHGSDVASLLIGNGTGAGSVKGIAPDADVTFYAYGTSDITGCLSTAGETTPYGVALKKAVDAGAKIVTTSVGSHAVNAPTVQEIAWALSKGVILVAATPNGLSGSEADTGYPDRYNGVVAVNAIDSSGKLQPDGASHSGAPDVQPDTTVVAAGVNIADAVDANYLDGGSSLAAPLVAGMLADVWQKYPKATANQLIQSLIHNTSSTSNPDGYGYGYASLTNMLKVDPTTYPNRNPLMNKQSGLPTAQQVAAAGTPASKTDSPGKSPVAAHTPGKSSSGSAAELIIGVVLALLVLAGIAVLIVVVVRSPRGARG